MGHANHTACILFQAAMFHSSFSHHTHEGVIIKATTVERGVEAEVEVRKEIGREVGMEMKNMVGNVGKVVGTMSEFTSATSDISESLLVC